MQTHTCKHQISNISNVRKTLAGRIRICIRIHIWSDRDRSLLQCKWYKILTKSGENCERQRSNETDRLLLPLHSVAMGNCRMFMCFAIVYTQSLASATRSTCIANITDLFIFSMVCAVSILLLFFRERTNTSNYQMFTDVILIVMVFSHFWLSLCGRCTRLIQLQNRWQHSSNHMVWYGRCCVSHTHSDLIWFLVFWYAWRCNSICLNLEFLFHFILFINDISINFHQIKIKSHIFFQYERFNQIFKLNKFHLIYWFFTNIFYYF